jgi:hypothetical protein
MRGHRPRQTIVYFTPPSLSLCTHHGVQNEGLFLLRTVRYSAIVAHIHLYISLVGHEA